jgi:hypothetical protein
MVERLNKTFQIANAIAVAVFVAAHKNFHEGAVLPTFLRALMLSLPLYKSGSRQQTGHDKQAPKALLLL